MDDPQKARADLLDDRARMADLKRRLAVHLAVQRLQDDGYEPPADDGYRVQTTISRGVCVLWPVQSLRPRSARRRNAPMSERRSISSRVRAPRCRKVTRTH